MQQQVLKIWIVKQLPGGDTGEFLVGHATWIPEPLPAKADLVQLTFANLYETKLPNALPIFKSLLSRNKLPKSKLSLLLNWEAGKFKFADLNFLIVNSWFL